MKLFGVLAGVSLSLVPVAARAVVVPFATFSPVQGTVYNTSYDNNSRTLYTTNNATSSAPGTASGVLVKFDFLQNDAVLNSIGVVNAVFTLSSTSTGAASVIPDTGTIAQGRFNGVQPVQGFSFLSANSFTASNGVTYAAGTNLLSGSFTNASLSSEENSTAASFRVSTPGTTSLPRTVVYTSDFLDFSQTVNRSFSFNLDALAPPANVANGSFETFSAVMGGTLSSDPAPLVSVPPALPGVPEPGTWGMMLLGFGVVGFAMRRRVREIARPAG